MQLAVSLCDCLLPGAADDGAVGGRVLPRAAKVVGLGVNTSAVETPVVWGEGDVLRKCEAGLYSSVTLSPVVSPFADVGMLVRGTNQVVASTWASLLSVVTALSVEICGAGISGLVGKSCFPAVVWAVVGSAIRAAVVDAGLGG